MNVDKTRLKLALEQAAEYVLGKQSPEGFWLEWNLPPGGSDMWSTAFIGWRLRHLPRPLKFRAAGQLSAACEWLKRNVLPDGGWAYSARVESDADSTALAILFLSSHDYEIPERSFLCLQRFQCADGGFATFQPHEISDSWRVSHLDVTPAAVRALALKDATQMTAVRRGLDFLLSRHQSGVWQSFWWTSFLYGTEACASCITGFECLPDIRENWRHLSVLRTHNAFETALLISILLEANYTVVLPDLVQRLIATQLTDGSWDSGARLRLPPRDCFEPWRLGDLDHLFCDQNRLFTTSLALDVLCRIYQHQTMMSDVV